MVIIKSRLLGFDDRYFYANYAVPCGILILSQFPLRFDYDTYKLLSIPLPPPPRKQFVSSINLLKGYQLLPNLQFSKQHNNNL